MQLSQRYNRYRPTTQTQTITDGSYQFDELFAAVKLASLKNDPNDSAGDVVATQPVRFGTLYVSAYAERHSGKLQGHQEGREQPDRLR